MWEGSPAAPQRSQAGAPPTNPQIPSHQPYPAAGQAPQSGLAAAQRPWMPQPHTTPNPVQHPHAPKPQPGTGLGGYQAGAGPSEFQAPRDLWVTLVEDASNLLEPHSKNHNQKSIIDYRMIIFNNQL